MTPRIVRFVSPQFDQNAYLVSQGGHSEAVVIDPGFTTDALLEALAATSVRVAAILLTHGHVDHIAGVHAVKRFAPDAPVVIGTRDAAMLSDPRANLSAAFGVPITAPPADRLLEGGETLTFSGLTLEVLNLPGHSPGHVVYALGDDLFVGDTLFAGSVGRSDFPGGSHAELVTGIRTQLLTRPDDCRVHPGHGPATTIGAERRGNPFLP